MSNWEVFGRLTLVVITLIILTVCLQAVVTNYNHLSIDIQVVSAAAFGAAAMLAITFIVLLREK